ncbi:MAG TPA: Uma2 family endonuclease [Gemmataceae bacterium]|nr:Uma2 family endonuclease [Gemmataceae bacterium]
MNIQASPPPPPVIYPESDGKPMADNTKQLRWITTLYTNFTALFDPRPDVFVAADLLWYPVEGQPEVRAAPDVLVVFGRPKGDRGSYKQWEEGGIPVTVAFEVLSPGNTALEMNDKQAFYEEYGVEEYYLYDPDQNQLRVFVRRGEVFRRVRPVQEYTSPRLGIRFDLSGEEMAVYRPDGQRFLTLTESEAARRQAERRAARLAELSRKARRGQASAEELQELDRLEEPPDTAPGMA